MSTAQTADGAPAGWRKRLAATVLGLLSPSPAFRDSSLGRVLNCLVIACLVAVATKPLMQHFEAGLDSAVQSALLQSLPMACEPGSACERVVLVAIDDKEFRELFQQRSPLDPGVLTGLVQDLVRAAPAAVAFDLDMAPASDEPAERAAREQLKTALLALGQATQGRTAMVCPQGYATAAPSSQDREWVAGFAGSPVRFASAELDSAGLYVYTARNPLALATLAGLPGTAPIDPADAARAEAAAADADALCQGAAPDEDEGQLIRPQRLLTLSLSQARAHPELLAGKVVVVGGTYGVSDRFTLRGVDQPVYGVELHAWIAGSAFEPVRKPPFVASLWLDVAVGLLTGSLFTAIWSRIQTARGDRAFARRALFYGLFLLLAVVAPAALLLTAVKLAQYNVFISSAAMIVSVIVDGILSSHERLMEDDEQAPASAASHGPDAQPAGVAPTAQANHAHPAPSCMQQFFADALLTALALILGAAGFGLLLMPQPDRAAAVLQALALGAVGGVIVARVWPWLVQALSRLLARPASGLFPLVSPPPPHSAASQPVPPLPWWDINRVAQAAWLLLKLGVVIWALLDPEQGTLYERAAAAGLVLAMLAAAAAAVHWKRPEAASNPADNAQAGGAKP